MDISDIQSGSSQSNPEQPKATFDVTPERPFQTGPAARPEKIKRTDTGKRRRLMIIGIIAVLVVTIILLALLTPTRTTITTTSTTIAQTAFSNINRCSVLSKPGTYYLSANIKYPDMQGACINVTSDNVALVCNRNSITGSGPYGSVPPFTYGIYADGVNNVSASGCIISNFSYGIALSNSAGDKVSLSNLSLNTLSNLFIDEVSNSSFSNNYLSRSASRQGSIGIAGYSPGNRFINNTVASDAFYGMNISSAGETLIDNYLYGSPSSFICSTLAGLKQSSIASGNTCTNSTGCGFLTCKGINTPPNISSIVLQKQINSCGSIVSPGNYGLVSDISMASIINTSNPLSSSTPCISIDAPNVYLNCSNRTILDAPIAILVNGERNSTISGCRISHAGTGIYFKNSPVSNVFNSTIVDSNIGLEVNGSLGSFVKGLNANGNYYGLYLSSSNSGTFSSFNLSDNQYGVYVNNSLANIFTKGIAYNNSRFDVYANSGYTNNSDELMQLTACGLTNANWAACTQHVSPSTRYYPLSSCGTINKPGNYSLQSNTISTGLTCFSIKASNVILSCASHSILSSQPGQGSTFNINGLENVTISDCSESNFASAVIATNSSGISVENLTVNGGTRPILFYNITKGAVLSSTLNGASNAGIYLQNVSDSNIAYNKISGTQSSSGIVLNNSMKNSIINNTGLRNGVGMLITGASGNNTVYKNLMQSSASFDYLCSPQDSNISSELNGINFGLTKQGCHWLAAVTPQSVNPSCTTFLAPGLVQLSADYEYTFGSVCYGVYSNTTTINCNGHTIISNSGGTFARFINSQDSKLENCYLKGFEMPVQVVNSSVHIINNTITLNYTDTSAINIKNSNSSYAEYNHIYSKSGGIYVYSSNNGYLTNNFVNASSIAYFLSGTSTMTIENNTSSGRSGIGMQLSNSTVNYLSDNYINGEIGGMICTSGSQASSSDIDLGGNHCSSNMGCGWISSSKSTC